MRDGALSAQQQYLITDSGVPQRCQFPFQLPTTMQLPADAPVKASDHGPRSWAMHPQRNAARISGTLLSSFPCPGHCSHWGYEALDGRSLYLSSHLCYFALQKSKDIHWREHARRNKRTVRMDVQVTEQFTRQCGQDKLCHQ